MKKTNQLTSIVGALAMAWCSVASATPDWNQVVAYYSYSTGVVASHCANSSYPWTCWYDEMIWQGDEYYNDAQWFYAMNDVDQGDTYIEVANALWLAANSWSG
jgi:hypothetical protein